MSNGNFPFFVYFLLISFSYFFPSRFVCVNMCLDTISNQGKLCLLHTGDYRLFMYSLGQPLQIWYFPHFLPVFSFGDSSRVHHIISFYVFGFIKFSFKASEFGIKIGKLKILFTLSYYCHDVSGSLIYQCSDPLYSKMWV